MGCGRMRLIDEKELINERPENFNPNMNDEIKSAYNKGWNACNSEWIDLIGEQPTAFNVDKVIEELEYEMLGDTANDRFDRGFNSAIHMCIKIIKEVARNDK